MFLLFYEFFYKVRHKSWIHWNLVIVLSHFITQTNKIFRKKFLMNNKL